MPGMDKNKGCEVIWLEHKLVLNCGHERSPDRGWDWGLGPWATRICSDPSLDRQTWGVAGDPCCPSHSLTPRKIWMSRKASDRSLISRCSTHQGFQGRGGFDWILALVLLYEPTKSRIFWILLETLLTRTNSQR